MNTDMITHNGETYIRQNAIVECLENFREERINVEGMAYEDNANIDEIYEYLGIDSEDAQKYGKQTY